MNLRQKQAACEYALSKLATARLAINHILRNRQLVKMAADPIMGAGRNSAGGFNMPAQNIAQPLENTYKQKIAPQYMKSRANYAAREMTRLQQQEERQQQAQREESFRRANQSFVNAYSNPYSALNIGDTFSRNFAAAEPAEAPIDYNQLNAMAGLPDLTKSPSTSMVWETLDDPNRPLVDSPSNQQASNNRQQRQNSVFSSNNQQPRQQQNPALSSNNQQVQRPRQQNPALSSNNQQPQRPQQTIANTVSARPFNPNMLAQKVYRLRNQ